MAEVDEGSSDGGGEGRGAMTTKLTLELEVEVEYSYDPGEPEVRYYANGDGHPGEGPSVEIDSVCLEGTSKDISWILGEAEWKQIEEVCLEEGPDALADAKFDL